MHYGSYFGYLNFYTSFISSFRNTYVEFIIYIIIGQMWKTFLSRWKNEKKNPLNPSFDYSRLHFFNFSYMCVWTKFDCKIVNYHHIEMNMNRQWTRERFQTISNILFWKPRSSSFLLLQNELANVSTAHNVNRKKSAEQR